MTEPIERDPIADDILHAATAIAGYLVRRSGDTELAARFRRERLLVGLDADGEQYNVKLESDGLVVARITVDTMALAAGINRNRRASMH